MLKSFWDKDIREEKEVKFHYDTFKLQVDDIPEKKLRISGHIVGLLPRGFMYLYGGYNDSECKNNVFVCDIENMNNWKEIKFTGFNLPELASCANCSNNFKVYVFGGSGKYWGRTNSDLFFELDFLTRESRQIIAQNSGPPASYGSSLVFYNNKIYLFGGTNGSDFYNFVWSYNLETNIWVNEATLGFIPSSRYKHEAIVVNQDMYIIGGGQYNPSDLNLDIYKLNLETMIWSKVDYNGDIYPEAKLALGISHDSYHNELIIFGGRNHNNVRNSNIFGLNLDTCKMRLIVTNSELEGREFHRCCMYQNKLISIGGSTGIIRLNEIIVFNLD